VASCDLAWPRIAGFALPGGRVAGFATPRRCRSRATSGGKRVMEMALTGDVVDAATAAEWGLINKAVPDDELDSAVEDLLARPPGAAG